MEIKSLRFYIDIHIYQTQISSFMNAVFNLRAKCSKITRFINVRSTLALEQGCICKTKFKTLKLSMFFFPCPLVILSTILIRDVSHYYVLFVFNKGLNHF